MKAFRHLGGMPRSATAVVAPGCRSQFTSHNDIAFTAHRPSWLSKAVLCLKTRPRVSREICGHRKQGKVTLRQCSSRWIFVVINAEPGHAGARKLPAVELCRHGMGEQFSTLARCRGGAPRLFSKRAAYPHMVNDGLCHGGALAFLGEFSASQIPREIIRCKRSRTKSAPRMMHNAFTSHD